MPRDSYQLVRACHVETHFHLQSVARRVLALSHGRAIDTDFIVARRSRFANGPALKVSFHDADGRRVFIGRLFRPGFADSLQPRLRQALAAVDPQADPASRAA